MGFLDSIGLTRLWNKIKSKFVTNIQFDAETKRLSKTINGVETTVGYIYTTDVVSINTELYDMEGADTLPEEIGSKIDSDVIIRFFENAGSSYSDYFYCVAYSQDNSEDDPYEEQFTFSNGKQYFYIYKTHTNDTWTYSKSAMYDLVVKDDTPTLGSNNVVKSNGLYHALNNLQLRLQSTVELAEGKTKNIVISDAELSGYDNALFNSTNDTIVIIVGDGTSEVTNRFKDVLNKTQYLTDLKVGDIISIIETNVPDRWLGSVESIGGNVPVYRLTFYKLETKFNIDSTTGGTANSTDPIASGAVYAGLLTKHPLIDASHKLDADLVDDSSSSHKFISASERTTWNGKYTKPNSGIPTSDLENVGFIEITMGSNSYGSLTSAQMAEAEKPMCIIRNSTSIKAIFRKCSDNGVVIGFQRLELHNYTDYYQIVVEALYISRQENKWYRDTNNSHTLNIYTKAQVDNLTTEITDTEIDNICV